MYPNEISNEIQSMHIHLLTGILFIIIPTTILLLVYSHYWFSWGKQVRQIQLDSFESIVGNVLCPSKVPKTLTKMKVNRPLIQKLQ